VKTEPSLRDLKSLLSTFPGTEAPGYWQTSLRA
jgi:hypothetical protein